MKNKLKSKKRNKIQNSDERRSKKMEKIYHVHELEDSIVLKCEFFPNGLQIHNNPNQSSNEPF